MIKDFFDEQVNVKSISAVVGVIFGAVDVIG
jgi:hypothetical protein